MVLRKNITDLTTVERTPDDITKIHGILHKGTNFTV
jgi:hypothetical protein